MSTIGGSQFSQSQIDHARNTGATQHAAALDPTDPGAPQTKSLAPQGGLSAAAGAGALPLGTASLDGINWDALVADLATTDTVSISISDIMVLLVSTMSEMRKGQREAWMADAQNALSMGLNAADRMRESAAAKMACDGLSNGVAMVTAAVQIGVQGASLAKQLAVSKAVDVQVAAAAQAQQKAAELGKGPMSMDLKMWATQEKAQLMQSFNAKVEIFSKALEIAGGFGKIGASVGEYFSGIKQAEAQEARARGDFANTMAQVELDFANELRDTMKAALDTMKSVEASRHQAMQGIYNI